MKQNLAHLEGDNEELMPDGRYLECKLVLDGTVKYEIDECSEESDME